MFSPYTLEIIIEAKTTYLHSSKVSIKNNCVN